MTDRRLPDMGVPGGGALRTAAPILAIAAGGVLLRVALVLSSPGWALSTDGVRFTQLAASGMKGTAFIPPLYPFFIRAVGEIAGSSTLTGVRLAQSILGGLTILLAASLARRLAPESGADRAGVLAAALVAFTPPLLLADLTIMSESLLALLATGWLVAAARGTPSATVAVGTATAWPERASAQLFRGPRIVRDIVAGILLGLLALAKAPMLLFTVVRPALRYLTSRAVPVAVRALLISTVALLLVLPWTLRNQTIFGKFVPVSTNGGYNFWKSFNEASTGTESGFDLSRFKQMDEGDIDAVAYAEGRRFIAEHPWRAVGLIPLKVGHFFGLERFFLIGVREGFWGPVPRWVVLLVSILIPATQLFWLWFAPRGLIGARDGGARREILLLAGFSVALHVVFNAEARYHVPLVPAFLAAAAAGIAGRGTWRMSRRTSALCILFVLLVVAFWGYEVFVEWEHLRGLGGS